METDIIDYKKTTIAGGFFLIFKNNIEKWHLIFDNILLKYFNNKKIVMDDQIIITQAYFLNKNLFELIKIEGSHNPWFVFHSFLR